MSKFKYQESEDAMTSLDKDKSKWKILSEKGNFGERFDLNSQNILKIRYNVSETKRH